MEIIGVKNTIQLLNIFRMPISPALNLLTKKGNAANEINLLKDPAKV